MLLDLQRKGEGDAILFLGQGKFQNISSRRSAMYVAGPVFFSFVPPFRPPKRGLVDVSPMATAPTIHSLPAVFQTVGLEAGKEVCK